MVRGGKYPRHGEVSLAHHGVLFLDELPEFKKNVLEVMRQPMEDGNVTIARAMLSIMYPANFMLELAIMEHANELLREYYDSNWSIMINTLTERKSGEEYKEDFKIIIYKDEYPRDFGMLSVEQQNMVESVLLQAINLVNQGQSSVKVAFRDESDGAF